MHKIISPDLSKAGDKEWVHSIKEFLKEKVPDSWRQLAKFANFGLPGGMSAKSFYKHCREGGVQLTFDEAESMRSAWINTFKEMRDHSKPKELYSRSSVAWHYGLDLDDEEEEEQDERPRQEYVATCINGMVRNHCSYNAAMNVQFQAIVAYGAKLAGWNLVYAGLGDRLLNYIHDEYLYWLWPDELEEGVPIVEQLMLDGMRQVIPDVKIGVETTCGIHWNKKAQEFSELRKGPDGNYIIEEPETVRNVLGA